MKLEHLSLDWLMARVRETEDGCWEWQRAMAHNGNGPQATIDYRAVPVRKAIFELMHERRVRVGFGVGPSCKNERCVHPDHLYAHRIGGSEYLPLTARAKIAATKRAASKLSQDEIRKLRESDEHPEEAARRLGVDDSYVYRIRQGKARKDFCGNAYAQLL